MKLLFCLLLFTLVPAHAANRVCVAGPSACTDGPREQVIDGMRVARPCWQRTTPFACIEPTVNDTCSAPRARGCSETGTRCLETAAVAGTSLCMTEERTFSCSTGGGESSTIADCAGQQYCLDGRCFEAGSAPDGDFKQAVAALEASREGGVYLDQDTLRVFRGADRRCSKTVVRNCCKGGDPRSVAAQWPDGSDLFRRQGDATAARDRITPAPLRLENGAAATPGAYEAPLQCDEQDLDTAQRRDRGFCHFVGDYCSKKVSLGLVRICVQHKETYCCFNSKIARIIAQAARAQLPQMGWGTPPARPARA